MSVTDEIRTNAQQVRARLRNPPNAVWDTAYAKPVKVSKPVIVPPPVMKEIVTDIPMFLDIWSKPTISVEDEIPMIVIEDREPSARLYKIREIQNAAAREFNITVVDIVSDRRTKKTVLPRHIAMYLLRLLTTKSFPEIGRHFGWRDHTTVMHGYNRIAFMRTVDPLVNERVLSVAKRLGLETI